MQWQDRSFLCYHRYGTVCVVLWVADMDCLTTAFACVPSMWVWQLPASASFLSLRHKMRTEHKVCQTLTNTHASPQRTKARQETPEPHIYIYILFIARLNTRGHPKSREPSLHSEVIIHEEGNQTIEQLGCTLKEEAVSWSQYSR